MYTTSGVNWLLKKFNVEETGGVTFLTDRSCHVIRKEIKKLAADDELTKNQLIDCFDLNFYSGDQGVLISLLWNVIFEFSTNRFCVLLLPIQTGVEILKQFKSRIQLDNFNVIFVGASKLAYTNILQSGGIPTLWTNILYHDMTCAKDVQATTIL